MQQVQAGDTVRVHYTGTLRDGTIFDSSRDGEPLEFVVGRGQVLSGVDAAVAGMVPGEAKTVTVAAEDAYGPHRDELTVTVGRDQLPSEIEPAVGQELRMSGHGQTFRVRVQEVGPDTVLLDANHPLAGEDLTFDLQLVDVR